MPSREDVLSATKQFIKQPVGDRAPNAASDVKNLQILLIAAGETVKGGADGAWGSNTAAALAAFQSRHVGYGVKVQPLVNPSDYVLLLMAWRAGILIPMPVAAGVPGCRIMHEWFVRNDIKYNKGAEQGKGNRAIYGVEGNTYYAVQTTDGTFKKGPVEMDCTTYVNLMLSIYVSGRAHAVPYDASCAEFGGLSTKHCARDRYSLPLIKRKVASQPSAEPRSYFDLSDTVNYFETAEQMLAATASYPKGLYVVEVATAGTGSVTHMALLHNGRVYEATTGQSGSCCISRDLAEFTGTKSGKIYYLFGPSPMQMG